MNLLKKIDRVADAIASVLVGPAYRRPVKVAVCIAIAAVTIWIPYSILRHIHASGFHAVSVEREIRVGREAARQLEKETTVLDPYDPVAAYVSEVGRRIALQNNPWKADFGFGVIRDPSMVNAFAFPGGRIYITTSMLKKLDNEAELAAVLAHEVAHVSRRHYARNMGRQMLMSWVKKFLGGTDRTMLEAGSFLTTNITLLRMRQQDELEADYQGTLYIYELDYDPAASVALAGKLLDLERRMPDFVKVFALTHPPSRERLEAMISLKDMLPEKETLTLGEKQYREKIGPGGTHSLPTHAR
jgi:predicted Zn-dependent protease